MPQVGRPGRRQRDVCGACAGSQAGAVQAQPWLLGCIRRFFAGIFNKFRWLLFLLWSYKFYGPAEEDRRGSSGGPISGATKRASSARTIRRAAMMMMKMMKMPPARRRRPQCHSMSTSRSTTARTRSPMAAMMASDSAAMLPLQCWWARSMHDRIARLPLQIHGKIGVPTWSPL